MATTLTGYEAIAYAEANGLTLNKYNDPTEDAREGVTTDEARKIAREDPSLIWLANPTHTKDTDCTLDATSRLSILRMES